MKKMILLASLVTGFTLSSHAATVRCDVEEKDNGYTVEIDTTRPSSGTLNRNIYTITTTDQNYVSLGIDSRTNEMSITQMAKDRKNTFIAAGSDSKVQLFWIGSSASLLVDCVLVK